MIGSLLDRGANPNTGPKKTRPIMSAMRHGRTDVVRCLLGHGDDLTGLRNPGADVLVVACVFSLPEVVALLLDAEQGLQPGAGAPSRPASLCYSAWELPGPQAATGPRGGS